MSSQCHQSKYVFMIIMSYVDVANIVRCKYLRGLNKRYHELALEKEEEVFNMLMKTKKTFNIRLS